MTALTPGRARWIFLGLAGGAFAALLVLGRHGTFRQDEWAFIGFQASGPGSYLLPHNEHWSTVPRLIYGAILGVVGLHSYLPYLAALLALHVLAAAGVFVLLARRLHPAAALVGTVPLLLLGSGYENLLWAFQMGFVGAVAAGTWALVVLEDRRRWAGPVGSALVLVSLASAGMGLFFLVAAGLRLLADPALRRRLPWLAIPALAYIAWYLAYGRQAVSGDLADPLAAAAFAVRGLGYAAGRYLGLDLAGRAPLLGRILGTAVLGTALLMLAGLAVRLRASALALAGFAGAGAMYLVVGLARAELADDFTNRSRYVYVAAFLMVPAAADLVACLAADGAAAGGAAAGGAAAGGAAAGGLAAGRHPPRAILAGVGALAILCLAANLVDLHAGRAELIADAGLIRAKLTIVAENHDAPWLDSAGLPYEWNYLDPLDAIIARYGSPTTDTLVASDVPAPTPDELDRALISLSLRGFVAGSGPASGSGTAPAAGRLVVPVLVASDGVEVTDDADCLNVAAGSGGWLTVTVPDGGRLEVAGSAAPITVEPGHARPPGVAYRLTLPPSGAGPGAAVSTMTVPDLGDGSTWQLRLRLGPESRAGSLRLCSLAP